MLGNETPWADRDELLHRCRGPRHHAPLPIFMTTAYGVSAWWEGGVKFWASPLTCIVALTTLSRYTVRLCTSVLNNAWKIACHHWQGITSNSLPIRLPSAFWPSVSFCGKILYGIIRPTCWHVDNEPKTLIHWPLSVILCEFLHSVFSINCFINVNVGKTNQIFDNIAFE